MCAGISLNTCCLSVANARPTEEISLGAAKLEVEIDADRQMVGIVGDVKAKKFFLLLLLVVQKREHKAAIGVAIVSLEILLALEDEGLPAEALATDHGIDGAAAGGER